MLSREWLYLKPHGQIPGYASTDVGTPGTAVPGWGVPRVVGRDPVYGCIWDPGMEVLGQYIEVHRASIMESGDQ